MMFHVYPTNDEREHELIGKNKFGIGELQLGIKKTQTKMSESKAEKQFKNLIERLEKMEKKWCEEIQETSARSNRLLRALHSGIKSSSLEGQVLGLQGEIITLQRCLLLVREHVMISLYTDVESFDEEEFKDEKKKT